MDDGLYTMCAPGSDAGRAVALRGWRIAVSLAFAWLANAGVPTSGANPEPALEAPVSAIWNAVPLRAWADRATVVAGRPVVLDRRLDPDIPVTRDCRGEPLGAVLDAVAAAAGASVEPLRSWIRIAPAAATGRATRGEHERREEIATLPDGARRELEARGAWAWPDGARPRDLVATAAADSGVSLSGIEAVPHDHLPAASLPPLPLAERLDLVLAHYDLRVSWTASPAGPPRGRVVPLPDAAGPDTPAVAGRSSADRTRADDEAGATPRRRPDGKRPLAGDRYTLALEAPLDEALRALGPRLGLEPELDRASLAARGVLPGEIVKARVTDATRDQLLDALVSPLGLRWRIDGTRLVIDAPAP